MSYEVTKINDNKWKVHGADLNQDVSYYVTHKKGDVWLCSCEAGKWRGLCKHVLAIKVDLNPGMFLPKTWPVLTAVSCPVFRMFYRFERFVASRQMYGSRAFLTFAGNKIAVHFMVPGVSNLLGNCQWFDGQYEDQLKVRKEMKQLSGYSPTNILSSLKPCFSLSGTTLDIVFGTRTMGEPMLWVMDCVSWKGVSKVNEKLLERLKMVRAALAEWRDEDKHLWDYVAQMEWVYDPMFKDNLKHRKGESQIVLKDLAGVYSNKSNRNWIIFRKGAKSA